MTIREEAFAGQPISCHIIDAHTHIGPYHLSGWHQKYDRTDTASILEDSSRIGIDCIVTAPHIMVHEQMSEANALAAKTAAEFPGKVYGYISVVPACGMEAIKQEIALYGKNASFLGLKFLTAYHGSLLQKEYAYAMDFAEEMGCPVLCHVYGNSPDKNEFSQALKTRHNIKLILAHQGGGYRYETLLCAPIIRNHENAYMELCGSLDNSLGVEQIVDLVGENKVIFGTDAINLDPKYELGRVALSPLNDEIKKKIFAENYLALLEDSHMGKIRF